MSTRTAVVIFTIVFGLGILFLVIFPFSRGSRPSPEPSKAEAPAPVAKDELKGLGVFRSDDGGKTWQAKSWIEGQSGSIAGFKVNKLASDPSQPSTLYLATDGNGLWISRNGGDLWGKVVDKNGVLEPTANVLGLAVNPDNLREWYLAVYQKRRGRVLRTTDGGLTFSEIYSTPLELYGVFDLYYDRGLRTLNIATGQGALLETADQGKRWRAVRWFSDGLVRVLVNPIDTAIRFVVTPRGSIFKTEDRGSTWVDVTPALSKFSGATTNQVWLVGRNGTLWLGSGYGLLSSKDNGASFQPAKSIISPNALISALAVDANSDGRMAVSALNRVYRTSDAGATWEIFTPPTDKKVVELAIDIKNPDVIYAVAN